MEAKVLPFRRPHVVVFERFDVEDMAAFFRAKVGSDVYLFTILDDGGLDEWFIRRDDQIVPNEDFTSDQRDRMNALYKEALAVYQDQLKTWVDLSPGKKLALLIHWGEETVSQLKRCITAAATDDPQEHVEDISLMCKDLETHEAYLAGLEAALSLL
jgi:hypothetical protein